MLNIAKMTILPKFICKFNGILIEIPIFTEMEKADPKILRQLQGTLDRQDNLEKEQSQRTEFAIQNSLQGHLGGSVG